MSKTGFKKDTVCVHAGSIKDSQFGGVNSPIYTSSAFEFLDQEDSQYPRYFNTPNQKAISDKICALEEGEAGMVLSSGMAAISTVFASLLKVGDHVILQEAIYGGTHYFAKTQLEKLGVTYTMVSGTSVEHYKNAIQDNTKVLYFETPGNPLLDIIDVEAMALLAKEHQLTSVIDNTFASPINLNPISFGVDVVIHSGTKYLGGHSDLCFGAVVTNNRIRQAMQNTAINWGGSLNGQTCALIERSLKTLALRVHQQNHNAMKIAETLYGHKSVDQVYYPGLPSHPGHEVAKRQMKGFGGMLSFSLGGGQRAEQYCRNLKLVATAVSLGGIESSVTIPSITSHAKLSAADREKAGINDHLIRLSVGIEDGEDLVSDLLQALG